MRGGLQIGVHAPLAALSAIARVFGKRSGETGNAPGPHLLQEQKGRVRKGKPDLSTEGRMWRTMDLGGKGLGRWSVGVGERSDRRGASGDGDRDWGGEKFQAVTFLHSPWGESWINSWVPSAGSGYLGRGSFLS